MSKILERLVREARANVIMLHSFPDGNAWNSRGITMLGIDLLVNAASTLEECANAIEALQKEIDPTQRLARRMGAEFVRKEDDDVSQN